MSEIPMKIRHRIENLEGRAALLERDAQDIEDKAPLVGAVSMRHYYADVERFEAMRREAADLRRTAAALRRQYR